MDKNDLAQHLRDVKAIALRHRALFDKPLGVVGELAELVAAEALSLELAPARQAGYDAIAPDGARIQIKGRCLSDKERKGPGGRVSAIRFDHDFDLVALVLLDERLELIEILTAPRDAVRAKLTETDSKARARGALSISMFRSIATRKAP